MKARLAKKILTSKKPYWVKKKYIAWQMICYKKYPAGVDNRIKKTMDWYLRENRKRREKYFMIKDGQISKLTEDIFLLVMLPSCQSSVCKINNK